MVKPFYLLVVEAEIQNRVGADIYGSYFALLNFSFILNIIPDLGTNNWNTYHTAQKGKILTQQLSGMITLRLILAIVYFAVCVLIGWILDYSTWQMWLLSVLAINQLFATGILFFRSYLTGLHFFKQDSVVSVLDRLILAIAMAILLWGNVTGDSSFQVEWLVYGQTVAYLITLLTAFFLVLQKSGRFHFTMDYKFVRNILKASAPFTLMSFLSMMAYRVDGVMLERMNSPGEAGIYAMCYRFFDAGNMFSYLFAVLLLPMFARMLNSNDSISELFQQSFRIMFSSVLVVVVTVLFFGGYVLSLIYDHHIAEATPVLSWLMASMACFSLQYIFGTLITASGNLKPLIYIALGAMIYNVLLNIFYIPSMGALGAAKASLFTQTMILLAQIMVVFNRFEVGNFKTTLLRAAVFAAGCVLLAVFFTQQTIFELPLPYSLGLFITVCLLLSFVTKMLNIRGLVELVKARA